MQPSYHYELRVEDYEASQRLSMSCKRAGRSARIAYRVFPIISGIVAALVLAAALMRRGQIPGWGIGLGIGALYPVLFFQSMRRRTLRNAWKAMLRPGQNTIDIELRLEDDQLISIQPGNNESRFLWRSILKLLEDGEIALLFLSEKQYLFIPKRALNEDAWDRVRARIAANGSDFVC